MKKVLGIFLILIGITASCLTSIQFAKAQSENSWVQKAPMLTARSDFGVAVVNGIIYAIGGSVPIVIGNEGTSASTNVTEAYDPTTNAWTEKAPMPIALSSFGIAVYQNKIYCIGQNQNEVYDPSTNTWETKTPMPAESYQLQANVVNSKIYLIGGYPNGAVNEVYDPAIDSWTTKAPIPTTVADYASAVVDGKIYIISGNDVSLSSLGGHPITITNLTQIYDPVTDKWSLGVAIPMGVYNAAAGVTTGTNILEAIYLMGGCNATYPLDAQVTNQVYFPENNSWGIGTPMPIDRAGLAIAVVNNTLYAIGGGHNIFMKTSTVNMQYTPFNTTQPSTSSTPSVPELPTWTVLLIVAVTLLSFTFKKRRQTKVFSRR
jgi:N-acetylneuraminic acid mutarotase